MFTKKVDFGTRVRPTIDTGPGRTKQSFRDEVNVNTIVAKARKTGLLTYVNPRKPFYGDVSGLRSYQESLAIVRQADEMFMRMSGEIRARFSNDPYKMIAFLQDKRNLDEAVRLGMVTKREPVAGTAGAAGAAGAPKVAPVA